jgi:hypothetical protein
LLVSGEIISFEKILAIGTPIFGWRANSVFTLTGFTYPCYFLLAEPAKNPTSCQERESTYAARSGVAPTDTDFWSMLAIFCSHPDCRVYKQRLFFLAR